MDINVFPDAETVAQRAASMIADHARKAVELRGKFLIAFSGGRTPWIMLRTLANADIPWSNVHLFQVDERILAAGNSGRNQTHIQESLLDRVPIPNEQIHAMPVEMDDLEVATKQYASVLRRVAGVPPVLDVIHLGLGDDGHTASLVPSDPVLEVNDVDVAVTGAYQNARRMTMTYPVLNEARCVLWVVTGQEKADALSKLIRKDTLIPAGRVRQDCAVIFADRAAAAVR